MLAFIGARRKAAVFGAVGPNPLNPDCTSHPGWTLGRQVAWAPGGREILVFGVQNGRPGTFGLIQFLSNVPYSGHATDWGQGKVVTSTNTPRQGVIAGAFSPDGKQIGIAVERRRGLVPPGAGSARRLLTRSAGEGDRDLRMPGGLEARRSGTGGAGRPGVVHVEPDWRHRGRQHPQSRRDPEGDRHERRQPGLAAVVARVADVAAMAAPTEAQRLVLLLPDGSRVPISGVADDRARRGRKHPDRRPDGLARARAREPRSRRAGDRGRRLAVRDDGLGQRRRRADAVVPRRPDSRRRCVDRRGGRGAGAALDAPSVEPGREPEAPVPARRSSCRSTRR